MTLFRDLHFKDKSPSSFPIFVESLSAEQKVQWMGQLVNKMMDRDTAGIMANAYTWIETGRSQGLISKKLPEVVYPIVILNIVADYMEFRLGLPATSVFENRFELESHFFQILETIGHHVLNLFKGWNARSIKPNEWRTYRKIGHSIAQNSLIEKFETLAKRQKLPLVISIYCLIEDHASIMAWEAEGCQIVYQDDFIRLILASEFHVAVNRDCFWGFDDISFHLVAPKKPVPLTSWRKAKKALAQSGIKRAVGHPRTENSIRIGTFLGFRLQGSCLIFSASSSEGVGFSSSVSRKQKMKKRIK